MTQPIHYDNLDLMMRICEKKGYGCHYGRFVAETKESDRKCWLDAERKKQDKKDAERRAKLEEYRNK